MSSRPEGRLSPGLSRARGQRWPWRPTQAQALSWRRSRKSRRSQWPTRTPGRARRRLLRAQRRPRRGNGLPVHRLSRRPDRRPAGDSRSHERRFRPCRDPRPAVTRSASSEPTVTRRCSSRAPSRTGHSTSRSAPTSGPRTAHRCRWRKFTVVARSRTSSLEESGTALTWTAWPEQRGHLPRAGS